LLHARLISKELEERLLKAAQVLGGKKEEIESQDNRTAQVIDLYLAIQDWPKDEFVPGDLIKSLLESDAWAPKFAKFRTGIDEFVKKGRAGVVGYMLKDFRINRCGPKGRSYDKADALAKLKAHVPASVIQDGPPPKAASESLFDFADKAEGEKIDAKSDAKADPKNEPKTNSENPAAGALAALIADRGIKDEDIPF
jgi:hypothetical protein